MDFVILAAGRGIRLRPLSKDRPKCLLEVRGRTILEWQLDALARRPEVGRVRLVAGYRLGDVAEIVARSPHGHRVDIVENPWFASTDSLFSLWLALSRPTHDFAVVNGDTVFSPRLLNVLLQPRADRIRLVVSRCETIRADAVKVIAPNGRLQLIGKDIDSCEATGESVGLARFHAAGARAAVAAVSEMLAERGGERAQWNRLFKRLLDDGHTVHVTQCRPLEWFEVDRIGDLEEARRRASSIDPRRGHA